MQRDLREADFQRRRSCRPLLGGPHGQFIGSPHRLSIEHFSQRSEASVFRLGRLDVPVQSGGTNDPVTTVLAAVTEHVQIVGAPIKHMDVSHCRRR